MDIQKLFSLTMGALNTIHTLAQQGKDITPTMNALKKVYSKHPEQVTDEELDETEAALDADLDEFEKPLTRKA